MPKSDVSALFAAFGETGDNYKELFDQNAGLNAQETWPLLRSFSDASKRGSKPPAPTAGLVPPGTVEPSLSSSADDTAFPLLGNVRLAPMPARAPYPRYECQLPLPRATAEGASTDLKQLFSRLAGRAQPQPGDRAKGAETHPSGDEVLGAVFNRLSSRHADEAEKASSVDMFSGLRK